MPLNTNIETISLQNWLDQKLNESNCIIAKSEELNKVPSTKGIYFWFMRSDLYTQLSNHISINRFPNSIVRNIKGVGYDLIYLGTAGTGNKGKSNLKERLNWHINQDHNNSAICSGILSTFRAGLSSLLAEDLQLDNTKEIVDEFQKSLIVYWISYDDIEFDNIDSDEKILIDRIRPLFNIKNNPNAKSNAIDNSTKRYKKRRAIVYEKTRNRLKCLKLSDLGEGVNSNKAIDFTLPSYNHQVEEENNCILFTIFKNQSIHDVVNGIDNLPTGLCTFLIHNSDNINELIYPSSRDKGWRKTGKGLDQNIKNYFVNVDTNLNNRKRWEIIQSEMVDKNIEEATVMVCSININDENTNTNPIKQTPKKPNNPRKKMHIIETVNSNLSDKFNVAMICSSKKVQNSELNYNNVTIDFGFGRNQVRPTDKVLNSNINWVDFVKENQNNNIIPCEANVLYKNSVYHSLYNRFNNNFYILSAGWGLVRSTTRLPKYDITFNENYDLDSMLLFNQFDQNDSGDMIFISSGNKGYHKLFNSIIEDLNNRVIIYFRPKNGGIGLNAIPDVMHIYKNKPNVILRAYNGMGTNYNWYYNLANEIALIQNPKTINDLPGHGIYHFDHR